MESRFEFRFYNAGKRVSELMRFSTPAMAMGQAEKGDGVSYWALEAPEQSWFTVPTEIAGAADTVRVDFAADIKRKFGSHGIVLLDPRHDPATEDPDKELSAYALAPTEELVIARAEKLWEIYTLSVIDAHLADSDQAQAAGGRPRKATGFTKFCFKLHGKVDPGDTFSRTENVAKSGGYAALQSQLSMLTGLVVALASGQKLDPEELKALLKVPGEAATPGKPVTSGIATGKINEPRHTGGDGWAKGEGNLDKGTLHLKDAPKSKSDRTKEAVGAL